MSLFCRSSWIPPFSKGSTSLAKEGTSINQSIIRSSSGLVRSFSWYFIRLPSFLYLFIQLVPICPCFAGAVEFLLSVRVQLLLQQKEHTINHSLPWARSVLQSVSRSSSFLPSYLPSFMHSLNWVPRCPCFAGAVEFLLSVRFQLLLQRKVQQSINHSFWARSVSQSLFCSSSFLPSFIQVGTKISLFCRSSWIPPFSRGSTSRTKQGTSINHSINHSLWARSVSQSVVCSSSYHPSFLHSFNWEPRCPCFAGAVEFFLLARVQLLLQRKAHQSIKRSMNKWINQSMDQSIDKSKPKRVLPIIFRTAEECFFLKPFLRKRPSKRL